MDRSGSDLLTIDLPGQICFRQDPYDAYLLSPDQFRPVARWVGEVRAWTYRQISPHGPARIDLDGRDAHYWHLLVWDRQRGELAGALRMIPSGWHRSDWDGSCSYLEHCYPGLDGMMAARGLPYVEIGRTFVAEPYQREGRVLLVLFRAMGSIPLAIGHPHLLGMVSYNHFPHSEAVRRAFLSALLQPPFRGNLAVPPARHPWEDQAMAPTASAGESCRGLAQLEQVLASSHGEPFRVPLLLKKYRQFGNAGVIGVSVARDFNQITEILMHTNLEHLSPRQRRYFVVSDLRPVWQGMEGSIGR
jgi:hypothetical protein